MSFVLAARTLRHRRSSFLGSFVALVLSTALLGGVLSVLTSAAGGTASDALEGIESALSFLAGLGVFLSVFIVAGTFAFAVATRARELALIRVIGATGKQIRALIRAEALLVGVLGSAVGALVGLVVGAGAIEALVAAGIAPSGLHLRLSGPTLAIAVPVTFGIGLLVAWLGAAFAGRRASRIPPLAALREADVDRRVMTPARWIVGSLFLVTGIGAAVTLPMLDGEVQVPIAVFLAEPLVIAIVALAPVFAGGLCASAVRGSSASSLLARANLRTGLRRATSTMAPVVLMVGICGALLGNAQLMAAATATTIQDFYPSSFVTSAPLSAVRGTPGVAGATPIGMLTVDAAHAGDAWTQPATALTVDPATMRYALHLTGILGAPDELRGRTVMAGRTLAGDLGWQLGDEVHLRLPDGSPFAAKLVALYSDNALVESLLLPRDAVAAPSTVHVQDPGRLPRATITPTTTWLRPIIAAQSAGLRSSAWLFSGFALCYALLSVANTTAMAFRTRREEFRLLHLAGTTGGQLHAIVGKESFAIGAVGGLLGCAVAAGTTLATWLGMRAYLPDVPAVFPWLGLFVLTAAGIAMVTGTSRVCAPASGGRHR